MGALVQALHPSPSHAASSKAEGTPNWHKGAAWVTGGPASLVLLSLSASFFLKQEKAEASR